MTISDADREEIMAVYRRLNLEYIEFGPRLKALLALLDKPGIDKAALLPDLELVTAFMERLWDRITEIERLLGIKAPTPKSELPN